MFSERAMLICILFGMAFVSAKKKNRHMPFSIFFFALPYDETMTKGHGVIELMQHTPRKLSLHSI